MGAGHNCNQLIDESENGDDVLSHLGYAVRTCKALTVITYFLCVLGIVVDLGCFALAIRDLLKDDKQPFTIAVLECAELLEEVNEICIAP
ncbi:hypothetical protein HOLleu_10848 [Holothuria leucospilota]|uniref:Uncharacterized protein n=1 Tax=Holothuria leucospilota TaxID=206669 RepID=A0A9Q1CFQ0_HOLLE|nr:hypothetical protein HOLleu_10848 [Holothuria leucospilota]